MSRAAATERRRVRTHARIWLAVLALATGLGVGPAGAQVRPDTVPRDTVRGDTIRVPIPPVELESDTLPPDSLLETAPDSLRAAANFPVFPDPFPKGWASARWEWTRDELLRYRGMSLLELLERVPGVVSVRSGGYGRPAGVSALGSGGARLRVFWDGFELDPLADGSIDLQHLGLIDLERVRVDRTLGEIRVELISFRLADARPYSEVEIGAGNYDAKLLRALLSRPFGTRSVATAAYDVVTTEGFGRTREPFQFAGGRLTWSYTPTDDTALRLDLLQAGIERQGTVLPVDAGRRELVLRGRAEPVPGLRLDGALGRSWWLPDGSDQDEPLRVGPDTVMVLPEFTSTQAMLRAGYGGSSAYAEAAARVRGGAGDRFRSPGLDLSARGLFRPSDQLGVEGEARLALLGGARAASLSATARLTPLPGLSLFATAALGERWVGLVDDTVVVTGDVIGDEDPLAPTRARRQPSFTAARVDAGGARAGVEWGLGRATIGAAALLQNPSVLAPFGLPFDRGFAPVTGGRAQGLEAYASVPVPLTAGGLRLEGWYQRWIEGGGRPYLPGQNGRIALEYHRLFVGGQFEPTLRVEGVYRGRTLVPDAASQSFVGTAEAYALVNWYLQLRILDVRAFLIWDHFATTAAAVDLQGAEVPGPRLLYGVRWFFRN